VQMNNGHLMMQATFFIGPVDFYWTDRHGKVQRREMNTGDSNFISPFVPHSFTSRSSDTDAIIIAVTYGGHVRRAFTEFSRIGAENVFSLAGDKRDPALARRCNLKRIMDAECMQLESLVADLRPSIAESRCREILDGAESSYQELEVFADALNVRVSDLLVSGMEAHEDVVVVYAEESQQRAREFDTYFLAPLARTRHQPDLKTFDITVFDSAQPGEPLSCGLHTFVYHFGSENVLLSWEGPDRSHDSILRPGDSAYIAPMVVHRFSAAPESPRVVPYEVANPNGSACGSGRRLFLVRIPGQLHGETLAEFATFSEFGRARVGAETCCWYN